MDSNRNYRKVAEQTLTIDEPDDSPVMSFVASIFKLVDDFTTLEADIAEHEFARQGLRANGLEDLNDRFKTLTARYAAVQRVVSDPQKLAEHASTDDDMVEDDITRLRTAIHGFGDLDRVLDQIRDTDASWERHSGEAKSSYDDARASYLRHFLSRRRHVVDSLHTVGTIAVVVLAENYLSQLRQHSVQDRQ